MQYIPSPTNFRRSLEYALVAALVGLVLAFSLHPMWSLGWDSVMLVFVVGILFYILLGFRELKKNGFDEKGFYRRGSLLFSWTQVKKVGLKFAKRGGSVILVAQPTLGAILSGPLMERETWVDYGVHIVFSLEDGRVVLVASNLDRLTTGGVVERLDEISKAANPRIEFE